MLRHQHKAENHGKLRKHDTIKRTNDSLVTDSKEIKIYELSGKKFRSIILRKLSKIQENTDKSMTQEDSI